ncbi:PilN domain-containing protein [Azohydromonas lata]|uniref:PilN domain-containing protein n=1 Tax=Azohydromonas lata TaxID=45677 RepID=UPI00082B83AF|nr:PilN domain-containing protein [Azohydromonas lata]
MLLINLLPHREARRRQRRQAFRHSLAVSAGAGLLLALLGCAGLQMRTAAQERRNDLLFAGSAALDAPLQAAARLRADIAALQARQDAWAAAQAERLRPVRLLQALARHTPPGVQLTALRQRGEGATLSGTTLDSPGVAALTEALAQAAPALPPPALVEMKAVAAPGPEPRRRFDFTLELRLQPLARAASGVAGGEAPGAGRAGKVAS